MREGKDQNNILIKTMCQNFLE